MKCVIAETLTIKLLIMHNFSKSTRNSDNKNSNYQFCKVLIFSVLEFGSNFIHNIANLLIINLLFFLRRKVDSAWESRFSLDLFICKAE